MAADEFKYKEIPSFTKREGNAIIFKGDGILQYYIPETYFEGKSATVQGSYIKLLGSFTYRIISKTGVLGTLRTFVYPSIFLCKPSLIEKKLDSDIFVGKDDDKLHNIDEEGSKGKQHMFRVLTFNPGDQLITNVYTPKDMDNVNDLLQLHIKTGKIPTTIRYDDLYNYIYESMELNGGSFAIHSQVMGVIYSKICRDPDDISNIFRLSKAINENMNAYIPIPINEVPKYISPFAAISSENFDEAVMSSVLLSDEIEKGKRKHTESPLEQVMMM